MTFSGSTTSFDLLLTRSAAVVLGVAVVWALLLLAAVLAEAATAGRIRLARALGCPPTCHRWLLGLAGAVLSVAVVAPTAAQASVPPVPVTGVLDGLPLPDRTSGGLTPQAPPARSSRAEPRALRPVAVSAWVTVRAGDSLWAISRSLLPPTASAARVADHARQLHLRNRRTIGADPDLIRPGQRLAVPPYAHETDSEDS